MLLVPFLQNSCKLVFFPFHYASDFIQQLVSIQLVFSILQLVLMLEKQKKNTYFMPHRNSDNLGEFLPNTPTTSNNQPFLFFDGCELEDPLGKQP